MSPPRSDWPVRRYLLGEEPLDDLSDTTTPAARLALMAELAREGWALSGRAFPDYARADTPTRLYRPGEPRGDE